MEHAEDTATAVVDQTITLDGYRLGRGGGMPAELTGKLTEEEYRTLQTVYKECLEDATLYACLTEWSCCLGTCCICFWVFCLHPIFLRMFARDDLLR
jgi:hypothetical protein